MKKILLFLILGLVSVVGFTQSTYDIETADIRNFWLAFDLLETAKTKKDSIEIIQKEYINKSTEYFKEFIKVRDFTAEEYVSKIQLYPKFWKSVRPLTEAIKDQKDKIEEVFTRYRKELPNYKQPNICFAIGCLRTGGTVSNDLILIGSEIAASNSEVDKSEMTGWVASAIGNNGDIVSMVAHEIVHTQQYDSGKIKFGRNYLLQQTMSEGIADFITLELINKNINQSIYDYGEKNECSLKKVFLEDIRKSPNDLGTWLYKGSQTENRPRDLGYFIGYKIAKEYYEKSIDKKKAIEEMLDRKNYKKIFKKSGYKEVSCG